MSAFSKLHTELADMIETSMPQEYKDKGWVYRDMRPSSPSTYLDVLAEMGEGNYKVLTQTRGAKMRSQFLCSKEAADRVEAKFPEVWMK